MQFVLLAANVPEYPKFFAGFTHEYLKFSTFVYSLEEVQLRTFGGKKFGWNEKDKSLIFSKSLFHGTGYSVLSAVFKKLYHQNMIIPVPSIIFEFVFRLISIWKIWT